MSKLSLALCRSLILARSEPSPIHFASTSSSCSERSVRRPPPCVRGGSATSQASCSFHLRQLAKYGFVEQAQPSEDSRERPWRLTDLEQSWSADAGPAADQLERVFVQREADRILGWLAADDAHRRHGESRRSSAERPSPSPSTSWSRFEPSFVPRWSRTSGDSPTGATGRPTHASSGSCSPARRSTSSPTPPTTTLRRAHDDDSQRRVDLRADGDRRPAGAHVDPGRTRPAAGDRPRRRIRRRGLRRLGRVAGAFRGLRRGRALPRQAWERRLAGQLAGADVRGPRPRVARRA